MHSFAVFDFAPVGLGVKVASLAFISLVGWRLIPNAKAREAHGVEPEHGEAAPMQQ